jgi:S1-C subfamily serine protease
MNPTMTDSPAPVNTPTAASVPPTSPDRPPRERGRAGRVLGTGLLVLLLGFGGGVAGFFASDQWLSDDSSSSSSSSSEQAATAFQPANDDSTSSSATSDSADSNALTPRDIYRKVAPGVVHIESKLKTTSTGIFGIPQEEEETGTGSGFIIDSKGHIVTNAHVVDGAESMTVSFGTQAGDTVTVKAKLVGEDTSADIAVIRYDPDDDALKGVDTSVVSFDDSSKVQVGDPVLAIGNPYGLDRTLTTGVVSALQRDIPALNEGFRISGVIQTDAAVNPGNSGGPLLDANGRVIGVNSQIQSKTGAFAGIAFAVPSSRVQQVAKQLIATGKVEYAWLGLAGGQVTPELVKKYDLPVDEGVLIGTVTKDSPASDAGLQGGREVRDLSTGETSTEGGDVILRFDGIKLHSMDQLSGLVDSHRPGDKVSVVFVHDGKQKTATVKLGTRPNDPIDVSAQDG